MSLGKVRLAVLLNISGKARLIVVLDIFRIMGTGSEIFLDFLEDIKSCSTH